MACCGYATVSSPTGSELFRYSSPDSSDATLVSSLALKYPLAMPYFFSQDPDYVTVKDRVAAFACGAKGEAEGIADIEVAVETLRLAEWLVEEIGSQLA
ncbi:hypothetical protein TrCOL_g12935 [Triparma columacea]|uniref:Uncharacterized protein n=1 Tax=Triparma columacea TaxID=722753 RepID=A0A9W7GQC3_9STRA|nr:hypothetical protein TrCOL_g12935 [Triparma columacea]